MPLKNSFRTIKPTRDNTSALTLFSGGQDSTTCLFWALKHFKTVRALCFNYGQRHATETEAARRIAEEAGVPFMLLDANIVSSTPVNALTDHTLAIDAEWPSGTSPNTFVPGRNLLFLTLAAAAARAEGIFNLVIGVSQADYSGYPDCRAPFIRAANEAINLSMDETFTIHTPLMHLTKAATWQLASDLGVFDLIRDRTITCYNGIIASGCGECPSCKLRREGLEEFLKGRVDWGRGAVY